MTLMLPQGRSLRQTSYLSADVDIDKASESQSTSCLSFLLETDKISVFACNGIIKFGLSFIC